MAADGRGKSTMISNDNGMDDDHTYLPIQRNPDFWKLQEKRKLVCKI